MIIVGSILGRYVTLDTILSNVLPELAVDALLGQAKVIQSVSMPFGLSRTRLDMGFHRLDKVGGEIIAQSQASIHGSHGSN